jgi:hypothetical protein
LVLDTNVFLVALLKHHKSKGKHASLKRMGQLLAHGGGEDGRPLMKLMKGLS